MNYPFRDELIDFFIKGKGSPTQFGSNLESLLKAYPQEHNLAHLLPLSTHDTERLMTVSGGDKKGVRLMTMIQFFFPGVPHIYYGDEIAMKYIKALPSKEGGYSRTGSRTPMQWSNRKNAGFSDANASKLYLPVDRSKNGPNVEQQLRQPNSLLNKVRRLIALRKKSASLCADGQFIPLYAKSRKYPFVYLRRKREERFLIALNLSNNNVSASFETRGLAGPGRLQMGTGTVPAAKSGRFKIEMAPVSYGIFRM